MLHKVHGIESSMRALELDPPSGPKILILQKAHGPRSSIRPDGTWILRKAHGTGILQWHHGTWILHFFFAKLQQTSRKRSEIPGGGYPLEISEYFKGRS